MEKKAKTFGLILAIAVTALVIMGAGCGKTTTEIKIEDEEHWSASTDRGDIKNQPISGKIHNRKTDIANVTIKKWDEEYDWVFSNKAPDSTCGVLTDNDAVTFNSKILQTGTFEKKMSEEIEFDDYHAYYHYEQKKGTPMSINPEWETKIVVKEIDEANKKVAGWAKFIFEEDKTLLEGSFTADLCE